MGNFMLRYLLRALVLAAALFCWVHALILSGDMIKSANYVSFRYGTDSIPCSTISRILEEEGAPFAAWIQKNNQRVTEQKFSRGADLQVLEIVGDAELVLPLEELLHGFLPVSGSMDACAIDAATAYALWGSMDVTGEVLIYSDKEYTVTGVFSRPENTMLMQSNLEGDISFPYLEFSVSDMVTSRQQADEFRVRYSLPEPDVLINHVESAAMLHQLAQFPAWLVAVLVLWRVLWRSFVKSASSPGRVGFMVEMMAGILISAWAIGFSPVIPAMAIPSRWSDFSFWFALIEEIAEQAIRSRTLSWPTPDMLRLQRQHSVLFYSGGALAGFVIGILWKLGKRKKEQQDIIPDAEQHS